MSIQAMAWVLEHSQADGARRLVLLAIANHADATGGLSWPSVELIGREARVSRATVFRCIDSLVGSGELERTPGGGRGNTNRYQLVIRKRSQKRSQDETLTTVTVSSDALNGLTGATQNRPEPKSFARAREVNTWTSKPAPVLSPEERARILGAMKAAGQ